MNKPMEAKQCSMSQQADATKTQFALCPGRTHQLAFDDVNLLQCSGHRPYNEAAAGSKSNFIMPT